VSPKRVLISEATTNLVEILKSSAGVKTSTEIVNAGLGLLNWAVRQTLAGRCIASYDEKTGAVEVFSMPMLESITPQHDKAD
jgi:hypothetical protein